jgi:hypothetical protein
MSESDARTITFESPVSREPVKVELTWTPALPLELQIAPTPVAAQTLATPTRPKRRQPILRVQERYTRIREIPRDVPIKEYGRRLDAMQRSFRTRAEWQRRGCPSTYVEALKDPVWYREIHDERQNAWRKPHKKRV